MVRCVLLFQTRSSAHSDNLVLRALLASQAAAGRPCLLKTFFIAVAPNRHGSSPVFVALI